MRALYSFDERFDHIDEVSLYMSLQSPLRTWNQFNAIMKCSVVIPVTASKCIAFAAMQMNTAMKPLFFVFPRILNALRSIAPV